MAEAVAPGLMLIAVIVGIALFPFGDTIIVSSPFSVKVVDITSGGVVAVVLLVRSWRGLALVPLRREAKLILLLLVIALFSASRSIDVHNSFNQVIGISAGAIFAIAVGAVIARRSDLKILLATFALLGSGICAVAFGQGAGSGVSGNASLIQNRATGIFNQPNNLGTFSAIVFVVGLALLTTQPKGWVRRVGLLASIVGLSATMLSLSRGCMIGIAIAVVAFFILVPERRWRYASSLAVIVLVLLFAGSAKVGPAAVQQAGQRMSTLASGNDNPYDERPEIWKEAYKEITERPLTGFGPNSFPAQSARSQPFRLAHAAAFDRGPQPVAIGADHAHDVLLTVGAELGVPGIMVVLALTLTLGWGLWRASWAARDLESRGLVVAVAAALTTVIGQGIVDFTLRDPLLLLTLWLFVGFALGITPALIRGGEPTDESVARMTSRSWSEALDRSSRDVIAV
jgi:putative inorganic carbon (HCO3(-)) transporter